MSSDSKRQFFSRIIDNLNTQIQACRSQSERNVLFAQKAFALARHSLISESKDIIRDLRSLNRSYEPRLSAWIMFAEGVIEHSETFDTAKSRDRILRAHLVGQAANDPTLAGTAAAWLAYFDFQQGHYQESADYLEKAFAWSANRDAEARSRASMVLGAGLYFAGNFPKAKHWLQAAREHAVGSGDIAMQNIVLFNSSALNVARLTLLDCTGEVDPQELNFALMSAKSAGNLNTALGISNQPSMIPVQQAEIHTIEQKWQEAINIFDIHIEALTSQGQSRWAPRYIAHRAWCKSNIGDLTGCRLDIWHALRDADACTDPDDACVIHFRIASAARKSGDEELSSQHLEMANAQLSIHQQHQLIVSDLFNAVADRHNPEQKNPA